MRCMASALLTFFLPHCIGFDGGSIKMTSSYTLTRCSKHIGAGTLCLSLTKSLCEVRKGAYVVCSPSILIIIVPAQQLLFGRPRAGRLMRWLKSAVGSSTAQFLDN